MIQKATITGVKKKPSKTPLKSKIDYGIISFKEREEFISQYILMRKKSIDLKLLTRMIDSIYK